MIPKIVVAAYSLYKNFQQDNIAVEVLKNLNFEVKAGDFIVISGLSGSGKTTLLNIIGGIDRATRGKVFVLGHDINVRDEDFLASFRCQNIGFVFQSYNLISTLTVAENVAFPMEWIRKPEDQIIERVEELLELVGLQHRVNHFSSQLSGGEQQRVAFARALVNDPPLLLVDEPTGNLDDETSIKIIKILQQLKKDKNKTIIVATHDKQIFLLADQRFLLKEGKLVNINV